MAFVLLGHARLAADDRSGAEAAYLHAAQLAPDLADVHLALARLYDQGGNQNAAALHAQRFVELAPDSADGSALLAAMRGDAGR